MTEALFATGFRAEPYWWDEARPPAPDLDPLPDTADIVIVGGGYTGLSAALTLGRLGHRPLVLDGESVGWGASSRNGGMVSAGLKLDAASLAPRLGRDRAEAVVSAAAAAFPFIEDLIAREGIGCDYVRSGRFSPAWTPAHFDKLASGAEALRARTGGAVRVVPRARQREELASDRYHGGLVVEATGALHPAKYAQGLAGAARRAGAVLRGGVRVRGIRRSGGGYVVDTVSATLRAGAVFVAVNGYGRGPDGRTRALPWLTRRVVPVASYIIATEPLPRERVAALFPTGRMIADTKRVLNYFRPSPDFTRVLWGGRASFRPGTTAAQAAPALHSEMLRVFPQLAGVKVSHAWTGNVGFTRDGLPHLGVIDGVHYAAGCQGSGVAMMTWLGHQAALRIAGAANAPFPLADLPFQGVPLYEGRPWFLPAFGSAYRLRDALDRARA